eukprot:12089066-Alexandrium_andersonii.AAC.1
MMCCKCLTTAPRCEGGEAAASNLARASQHTACYLPASTTTAARGQHQGRTSDGHASGGGCNGRRNG